jgi:hypothetical protein
LNILKLILGGVVAVVSAFGITITVFFALAIAETAHNQKATGLGAVAGGLATILHSGWFWLATFVIFAVGLFLSYRKLYFRPKPAPPA